MMMTLKYFFRLCLCLHLQIAGAIGATGANAPRRAVVGGNSGSDFVTVRMARGITSARDPERAHRHVTAMSAQLVPPFDSVSEGTTRKASFLSTSLVLLFGNVTVA